MNKATVNPFREGSSLRKIFGVLLRAGEDGETLAKIAHLSHVTVKPCRNLMAALMGRWHSAKIQRIGVKVVRRGEKYMLQPCRPNPKAKRPPSKGDGAGVPSARN